MSDPFATDPEYSPERIRDYQRRHEDRPKSNGHDRHPPSGMDRILTSSDFVQGFKPPDYVLDGILQRGFVYSFTALTGTGKTAVLLLLMAHVALGRSLGGREVAKGAVLMLAGENADDVRMRWIALAEQASFDADEVDAHFMPGVFDLASSFEEISIRAQALGGLSMVVVDTSAAYFAGQDENSNTELGDHARLIRGLTTVPGNPCVVAACHPTKNAAADNLLPRGGGAFVNEMDGNLAGVKTENTLEVSAQGKFRGPEFEPIAFELCPVTSPRLVDSKGKAVPTVVARTITQFEQDAKLDAGEKDARTVLRILEADARISLAEIALKAGWLLKDGGAYKSKAQRVLSQLKREKLVEKNLGAWEITSRGERVLKPQAR